MFFLYRKMNVLCWKTCNFEGLFFPKEKITGRCNGGTYVLDKCIAGWSGAYPFESL